jgi:NitT/TauT family transport system substrate-binding protein
MIERFRAISLAAAMVAAVAVAAPARAESYKVNYVMAGDGVYYILQYIAEDAGFYKQEHVEMVPVLVNSGTRLMAAVMGGSAEGTSVNLVLTAQAAQKGADVIAVSRVYDTFPHTLVLSNAAIKKTGITPSMPVDEKVKRLKGLRIGMTSPGSGSDQLVRTLLKARGYDPDTTVTLQPLGQGNAMLAAFEHGLVDGFAFTPPFPQIAVSRGLGQIVIDPFNNDAPELQGGTFLILATTRATLKAHRPALRAVVRAFTRAMKFAQQHPEQARKMTRRHFKQMDETVFNATFDKAIKGVPDSPIISQAMFGKTLTAMNIAAKKKVTATYAQVIDNSLADEAAKEILGHQ